MSSISLGPEPKEDINGQTLPQSTGHHLTAPRFVGGAVTRRLFKKLSTDRILTTHVGSLPRSQAVVDLLFKRKQGEIYDRVEFDRVMADAVSQAVRKQVEIGIDVVSDGETSKVGYATYIKDRLTGFDGDSPRQIALDLQDYPDFRSRMAVFAGKQTFKRQSCVGTIKFTGHGDLEKDIAHLRSAVASHGAVEGFMNAASAGVIPHFSRISTTPRMRPTSKRSATPCGSSMKRSRMLFGLPIPARMRRRTFSRRMTRVIATGRRPPYGIGRDRGSTHRSPGVGLSVRDSLRGTSHGNVESIA